MATIEEIMMVTTEDVVLTEKKEDTRPEEHIEFDDLLMELGEFGRYQKKLYVLLILPSMFIAAQTWNFVFLLGKHEHRCKIPEREVLYSIADKGMEWHNETFQIASYSNNNSTNSDNTVYHADECMVSVHDNSTNETTTIACTSWEYSTELFTSTVTSEFNLVCEEKIFKSHASMASFAGSLLSSLTMGALGDIWGRKSVLCVGVTMLFTADMALAWSPNIYAFTVIHFFSGFATMTTFAVAVVTILELVGPSKRTACGIIIEILYCIGELLLCAAAYLVRNWRHLQIVISAPSVVLLIYWFLIDESPRWLLSKGENEKAFKIIKKIAKVNKVPFSLESQKMMVNKGSSFFETLRILLRNRVLTLRIVILMISWSGAGIAYYGLTYGLGNIGGNIYINYFIAVLVECVGYISCLFLSSKLGRKITHCGSLIVAGIGCLLSILTVFFTGPEYYWITIALSMIGKCGVSVTYGNIYLYTPELFPTYLRSSVLGISNLASKTGTLMSPYIANIADFVDGEAGKAIPLSVFGCLTIIAGLLSLSLPETVNKMLPETIEEALELSAQDV